MEYPKPTRAVNSLKKNEKWRETQRNCTTVEELDVMATDWKRRKSGTAAMRTINSHSTDTRRWQLFTLHKFLLVSARLFVKIRLQSKPFISNPLLTRQSNPIAIKDAHSNCYDDVNFIQFHSISFLFELYYTRTLLKKWNEILGLIRIGLIQSQLTLNSVKLNHLHAFKLIQSAQINSLIPLHELCWRN